MDRTEYINRITTHLGVLAERVKASSRNGRMDINVDSEMTVCGLVNRLMGWELANLNDRKANFPGIDLADRNSRVAVQVTATATGHKINHTLDEFLKNGFDADFDRLIVIIITNDRLPAATARAQGNFRFDPEGDIWNLSTVTGFVRNLADPWKLEQIARFLDQELGVKSILPKYPLPGVPSASPSFVAGSRDEELKAAREILAAGQPVFLWGLGGMGKTETAIQLASAGNAYFLRFQDSLRRTILNADFSGYRFEGVDNERRELEYRERLGILRRQYSGAMLIIDNFDRPGRSLADLTGEETYSDLTQLDLDLVFTTRADAGDLGVRVDRIGEDDLLTLMRKSCKNPSVTDAQLRELIRAVDGHTLMVDLMAKTLRESLGAITPEEMLEAFRGGSLKGKKLPSVHKHQQGRSAQGRIDDHLRTLFDMSDMNPSEKAVLRYATLLPENGMDALLFKTCLSNQLREVPRKWHEKLFGKKMQIIPSEQDAFTRLTKTGWLRIDDVTNLLTIHPVVREVCREVLEPSNENCKSFLQFLWGKLTLTEYNRAKFVQMAEIYEFAVDILEDIDGSWLNASGCLWNKVHLFHKTRELYEKHILALEHRLPNDVALATAYNNLGVAYGELGDFEVALEYKLKALGFYQESRPHYHPDTATAFQNVGGAYNDLERHDKGVEYQLIALEIRERVLPQDHPDIALSYDNLGITYGILQEYGKSLEYLLKALTIRERIFPENHPTLANSYSNIGSVYADSGDFDNAVGYQIKALELREKVLPEDHPDLAVSYNNFGCTCGELGLYGQAIQCLEKALIVLNKAFPDGHPNIISTEKNIAWYRQKMEQQ